MTIPAIPLSGTGIDPSTLVNNAYYKFATNDQTGDTTLVLPEAIDQVARACNRTLAYGQFTERLYVYSNGYVYPSAVPIDPAQPLDPTGGIIQGFGVLAGWFPPLVEAPVLTGILPPQVDFTYWGGFQPVGTTTGPTPGLPPRLARAICKVAWYMLHPVILVGLVPGAKSVSVGDVSISGANAGLSDLSSFMAADPALCSDILAFHRPTVRAWGN